MRIALASDWTAPRLGGVERQIAGLAAQLRLHGHQVCIITFTPGRDTVDGIPVERLERSAPPGWRPLQRGLERVGYELGDPLPRATSRAIWKILEDRRIEVVHGHSFWSSLGHMVIKVGRDGGIPGVLTNHSLLDRAGLLFFRAVDEVFGWSEWPAVVTAVSGAAARDARLATRGRDVRVIPNGLDTTAWAYSRAAPRATGGAGCGGAAPDAGRGGAAPGAGHGEPAAARRPRIVSVMRLNARKDPEALLRALRTVRVVLNDRAPTLDLYGDGPLRPALLRRAVELGIAALVTFHGPAGQNEIARALATADLFALSGRREAFGIAAAEAQASGLPVVAMGGSGIDDVVEDGVGGLLANDEAELADDLLRLLEDDALRTRMAARAPAQVARFDWDAVTPLYLEAYRDALHG